MTLLRSGIIVAFFTLLSRIFGLLRELFIASLFGAGAVADSVNVAFKLPNLFRRIFGEGALSTVFVPIFNTKMLQSTEAACRFSGAIFTLLLVVLILLVLAIQAFMPSLMFIIAPGFYADPAKFQLTVILCRIAMPYLIFISITALFGAMLNSVKKFAAFAFVPSILSLGVIAGTLMAERYFPLAYSAALSLLMAGMLQVAFMFYCLRKANLKFPVIFTPSDRDVKKFLFNMGPAVLSSGAQQLNLFISQSLASFIPGAVSILSYADRIYQFPLSLIGVTFSTILLPELSKIYKTHNHQEALKVLTSSVKIGLLLAMPAACGIMVLSQPIIHLLYERGAFTPADTIRTAQTLTVFAAGLPAFVLIRILTTVFYANHDTKTPLRITIWVLLANIALNLVLMRSYAHIGIALGSAIAAWYNVFLLNKKVKKYSPFSLLSNMKLFYLKLVISCVAMSGVIFTISLFYSDLFYSNSVLVKGGFLLLVIAIGVGIFILNILYFGLHKILFSSYARSF